MLKPFLKQLGLLALLVALAGGILLLNPAPPSQIFGAANKIKQVQIGNSVFSVELAVSPAEKRRGLSGHRPLKDTEGMLFVFKKADTYGFWMKDMLFALDIVWIGGDQRIVYIAKDVKPESHPQVFTPGEPALYVLEINAGLSDKNGFKIGDKIYFLK